MTTKDKPQIISTAEATSDRKHQGQRIACIKELNDRALGRAPQAVEHSGAIGNGNGPDEHKPDIADLNKHLARPIAQVGRNTAGALTANHLAAF